MALAPLATVADIEARGVTVDVSETAIVTTYLDVASTVVRDAAGSPISETISSVTLEGTPEQRLRLPGLPVTSVTSAEIDGVAVTDYRLVSGALWRECGWQTGCEPSEVEVVYTHGLPTVPADILDMVCRMATQALMSYRSGDPAARPVANERVGDYAVTYTDAETGTLTLTDYQRGRLAARFGGGTGAVRSR